MKRWIHSLLVATALLAGSCERERIIPDEELALIFRDAYLIDAYLDTKHRPIDSLLLYEPLFTRYGYTTEDVQQTIANFSRRKSAKLSDVVEQSIALLEQESEHYDYEVSVLDSIDVAARRRYTRTIYADSLIRVTRLRDTADLALRIPLHYAGEYRIDFDYRIDSLDENGIGRSQLWIERADSSRTSNSSFTLMRERNDSFQRVVRADSTARTLVIRLLDNGNDKGKRKRPHLTVRNLRVKHIPYADDVRDSLYLDQLNIRIFAHELFQALSPDSLALSALPERDSL